MINKMEWDEVYDIWKSVSYWLSNAADEPVKVQKIYVPYETNHTGWEKEIHTLNGCDWVMNRDVCERTKNIVQNPYYTLCYGTETHKGTIHTAQMLLNAESSEERAAIWIKAALHEMKGGKIHFRNDDAKSIYDATDDYLAKKFYDWHYSSKYWLPINVSRIIACVSEKESKYDLMDRIVQAVLVACCTHTILFYTSSQDPNIKPKSLRI